MARRLVRQFKTQAAPADARGYTPQAVAQVIAPAAVDDPTVPRPAAHYGTLETPVARPAVAAAVDAYIPPPAVAQTPRTMGTPALPPDWYPETPNRIWSPDATTGTRRNTGADDIYDIPPVQRPTVTTTNAPINETGVFPQTEPEFVEATLTPNVPQQPWFVPPTATAATVQLPPQRPVAPPDYGQPPVPVDITPEQFTLPSPTVYPGENIPLPAYDRGIIPEVPPITTPIERPTPIDIGYIEPEQPIDLTPGPQVTATEQSFYNPQPVETAYAAPIEVPYPQPQLTESSPAAHYGELPVPQDEITNLIDTIIPKTIDIPQKGPQWVEDPHGLATQELIDQSGFTQTDPSIYSPPLPAQPVDQAPEIDETVLQVQPRYEETVVPETIQPLYTPPVETIQQLPITQTPELPMPEIPPYEGSEDIIELSTDIQPIVDDQAHSRVGTGNYNIVDDSEIPVEQATGGTVTGMENLPPGAQFEDFHRKTAQESPRKGIDYATPDQEFTKDPNAAVIAEILEEGTTSPASEPTVTADIAGEADTGEVDTSYPGVDAGETLPAGTTLFPDVDTGEDEGGHGLGEDSLRALAEDEQPEPRKEPTLGGQAAPDPTVTQPPVGQGGQGGWLYTGPQGYAQTRWSTSGAAQGPPVVSHTPSVTGPQVNRETGEITEAPLSWWSNRAGYDFMQPGASLPTGKPGGNTDDTGSTGSTGSKDKSGGLGGSFTAEQVAEMAGGSITPVLDHLHPGATSDGQTVTFGDIGNYDDWVDGVLDLRPDLKSINDLGYEKRDAEGNRVGWGNHALDGFNQITGTINKVFDFMGDPSKKFTAAILEDFGMKPTEGSNLKELAKNLNKWHEESSQMWETSEDKAWGRKWNDLTKTQEYGDMQPLGIFALLTNPPAAVAMTANSLLYDIKNAAAGMFNDNPNYKGNMAQDILNGAFHFLGKGAKSVGSLFGKLGKAIGGKLNFTSKDMKNDPMEVSRQLLYTSKYGPSGKEGDSPSTMEEWMGYRETGDVRYELVKTLLDNGVDVRFHNNAVTFDKGIAKARIEDIKKGISDMGLDASMIEIMAGTEGLDDFPELKAWLEARAEQIREMAKS